MTLDKLLQPGSIVARGSLLLIAGLAAAAFHAPSAIAIRADDGAAALPAAVVDRSYAVSLPLVDAEGSVDSRLRSGNLPEGLELTGIWLRGIPRETGTFALEIHARDQVGQQATAHFTLDVLPPPAAPLTNTTRLPPLLVGREYRAQLTCEGGYPPYSWSIAAGTLPRGLRLSENRLTGTVVTDIATLPDAVSLEVVVRDRREQSVSRNLTLRMAPDPEIVLEFLETNQDAGPTLPAAIYGRPYAFRLPVQGGYGALHWEAHTALPEGIEIKEGWLQGSPEQTGTWEVGVEVTDEMGQHASAAWQWEVLPPSPKPLEIVSESLPAAVVGAQYRASLDARGGFQPYRWSVRNLPSWARLEGQHLLGTPGSVADLARADLEVRVEDAADGTAGPLRIPLEVTADPRFPPPQLKATELPPATVEQPYAALIPARDGCPPLQFEFAAELPPGISDLGNGLLGGRPTSVGLWRIPVTITDALGQTNPTDQESELLLRVGEPPPATLEIVTASLPDAPLGETYRVPLRAHGGWPPYTWSLVGELPPWAELDEGTLSGVPSDVSMLGTQQFSIILQDSRGKTEPTPLTLNVIRNPDFDTPRIVTDRFPTAMLGDDYTAAVVIEGGRPPYSVDVRKGSLPDGMTLRPDGWLAGRSTERGDWPIDLQATDSLGQSSEVQTAVLAAREVASASLQLGTFSELTAVVNRGFDYSIPVSGGLLPYTFSLDGRLPDGLQFDERQGRLSGAPKRAGQWSFDVRVDDGAPEPSRATGALSVTVLTTGPSPAFAWSGWVFALVLASLGIAGMGATVLSRKKSNPFEPQAKNHE